MVLMPFRTGITTPMLGRAPGLVSPFTGTAGTSEARPDERQIASVVKLTVMVTVG